jgi:hypothetical protein
LWFAPGQLFEQLPSHHPAAQKTVLRKPLLLLRNKPFFKLEIVYLARTLQLFYQRCGLIGSICIVFVSSKNGFIV